ncbi:MAG: amino acid ABC transporter ATP-binding protein [Peptostreptococcaceae bacterium]|nr:amino acid ABC transporter ATP-binding protein [Peptostreptococcaceae bacterium]
MIKVENLVKNYENKKVLKGINLEIDCGKVVVIICQSGSGKSTFLRCLNRLEEPTSGKIFLDGIELTNKEQKIFYQRYYKFLKNCLDFFIRLV